MSLLLFGVSLYLRDLVQLQPILQIDLREHQYI